MKKDIVTPAATQVAVAVVPRENRAEDLWDIYLVNHREGPLENILVTSQGYGSIDGVDKTTTVLRHFHQRLAAKSAVRIEPIQSELFGITNEYWVSFNSGSDMLDKKIIFPAGTISESDLETLPILERPGISRQ